MKTLIIAYDPPYASARMYNALDMAMLLLRSQRHHVGLFLMADAADAALVGKKPPDDGYHNIERMLRLILAGRGEIMVCGTCLTVSAPDDVNILAGVQRASKDDLADAISRFDRVVVF